MRKFLFVLALVVAVADVGVVGAVSTEFMRYDTCVVVYGGTGRCFQRATDYYKGLGYSGTLYDMEMAYLGGLGYTGGVNDRWRAYLGNQGYTGTLGDRFRAARTAGTQGIFGLTFWAEFLDPANPLVLRKGTGTLSFTRATTATYVHPTTGLVTTAASGNLRIEANGALIEGQRTNLQTYSEDFSNALYNYNLTRIETNVDIAPDGTITADRLIPTAAAGTHTPQIVLTVADNTIYTYSVFLKKGVGTYSTWSTIQLRDKAATNRDVFINLSTGALGTISAGITGAVVSYDNGWYRLSASMDMSSGVSQPYCFIYVAEADNDYSYTGDNTSYISIWGAQLEVGASPSSYIPTVAAAVTRNASVLTEQTASNIDNVDGTIALQWTPEYAYTDNGAFTATLFDAGGIRATYTSTDRKINLTDGTNTVSSAALTFTKGSTMKLAFRWGPSGLLVYKDGTEAATGATYTAGTINANLYIGSNVSSANHSYSNIKPLRALNREFSAAEMGSITQ